MLCEEVDAAGEVPEVECQQVEAEHADVHLRVVARVDVRRVPVRAFAEGPQVGSEHDVPTFGELVRVVAVLFRLAIDADGLALTGAVTVLGEDRRSGPTALFRNEEVRRDAHAGFAVVDDPVPQVAPAVGRLSRLGVERNGGTRCAEQRREAPPCPTPPRDDLVLAALGRTGIRRSGLREASEQPVPVREVARAHTWANACSRNADFTSQQFPWLPPSFFFGHRSSVLLCTTTTRCRCGPAD